MELLVLKALHVIFVVSWFSGLFYLGRLFVYHVAAEAESEKKEILQNQFRIMQKKLWYIITWPACIGTLLFGFRLMLITQAYTQPWFHIKVLLIVILLLYHFFLGYVRKQLLKTEATNWTTRQLKLLNEFPTILLIGIVFTVYLKEFINPIYLLGFVGVGLGGLFVFIAKR